MKSITTVALFLLMGVNASADTIAAWNFNTYNGNGNPTTLSADHGSGTLSFSAGLSNSDVNNPATGTTLNAFSGDSAGNSFAVINGSPSNDSEHIDLHFSTAGLENLVLTYATTGQNGSFASSFWSYSTDSGATYTAFGNHVNPGTSYAVVTRDFSTITALNNNSDVFLRYTFFGAGVGAPNVNKVMQIDNIQLNASQVVPEPGTFILFGSGLVGISYLRRRARGSAKNPA